MSLEHQDKKAVVSLRGGYDQILLTHLDAWAEREEAALLAGQNRLPRLTLEELRSSGLLCGPVPRALGGLGADLLATVSFVRRVAGRAPSTALSIAMPLANAANTLVNEDAVPPDQRDVLRKGRLWIATKARDGKILAVANSEPGANGDLANTRTRALSERGATTLRGEKCFATVGPDADYFLCSARTEQGELDAFFVARDAVGLTLSDDWDALGMRLTASVSLTLNATPIAAAFLYPGAIAKVSARHWSTLLLASVFLGVGEGALASAQLLAPKLSHYARASLAECALSLEAARGFLEAVAREDTLPASAHYAERCRRAKTFAAKVAVETTTRALMVCGGQAYRPRHALARFMVDAAAGPLLRPPLPQTMDALADDLFGNVPAAR